MSTSHPIPQQSPDPPTTTSPQSITAPPRALLPFSYRPLDGVKLATILSGRTCPPISFNDYMLFVTNYEFTTENLLFVVWFQSYEQRWNELEPTVRDRVPVPSMRMKDRHDPFGHLAKGVGAKDAVGRIVGGAESASMVASSSKATSTSIAPSERYLLQRGPTEPDIARQHQQATLLASPNPEISPLPQAEQPMRDEALRAFATFLGKGGSRELGISDDMREFAKVCLARSSAPDCFREIYDEVYRNIDEQSVPQFLRHASANVNRPKQVFWYSVGFTDFLLGVFIYIILTLLLPSRHVGYRAIRLISTIFTAFGAMQIYSAKRHFCSQIWGRFSRQVKPWEMDDPEGVFAGTGTEDSNESKVDLVGRRTGVTSSTKDPFSPHSVFTENIFTPLPDSTAQTSTAYPPDSPEIHLNDMSGFGISLGSPPTPSPAGKRYDASSTSPKPNSPHGLSGDHGEDEDGLTDVQRRQLAIRRATVKIPDASLAFPISADDDLPSTTITTAGDQSTGKVANRKAPSQSHNPGRPRSQNPSLGSPIQQRIPPTAMSESRAKQQQQQNHQSLIAPFDVVDPTDPLGTVQIGDPLRPAASASGTQGSYDSEPSSANTIGSPQSTFTSQAGTNRKDHQSHHESGSVLSSADLTALLSRFRRKSRHDPNDNGGKPRKTPVFGPEIVVEDPRVKALFQSVVRDILVVGGCVTVVWVVLCLAVPCAGLLE